MAKGKKQITPIIIIVVLLVIAGVLFISEKRKADEMRANIPDSEKFENQVKDIFGIPESHDDSGISSIQYGGESSVITYKFYPAGFADFNKELGVELSDKIEKLYEKESLANEIVFKINCPYEDDYGNVKWLPVVTFEFDRNLNNRINWSNFLSTNLLEVVKNINWLREQ